MKRVDQSARCPSCRTGGRDVGSREGLKAIRYGGDDSRLLFECDSCEWSSRVYEYTGDNRTPLSALYGEEQSITFSDARDVKVNGAPLQTNPGYTVW